MDKRKAGISREYPTNNCDITNNFVEDKHSFSDMSKRSFGMPLNQSSVDLSPLGLSGLATFTINNLGDPYSGGCYQINSKKYERDLIRYIAKLYKLENKHWGYVTSCGSEGNMFGLYLGRETLTAKSSLDYPPIILYSRASHYSIAKAVRVLNIEGCPISCQDNDEIDYNSFSQCIDRHRHRPIIVS